MLDNKNVEQAIEDIADISQEMVGYECDKITFHYRKKEGESFTLLVFGAKFWRTPTPFFRLRIYNKCQLELPDQKSHLFVGSPRRKEQNEAKELLYNQVVKQVIFNRNTYALTIEFENDLTLSLPNDNENLVSYEVSRNVVPHPRGGRGVIITVTGQQIGLGFWMS